MEPLSLFDAPPADHLAMPDGEAVLYRKVFTGTRCERLYQTLYEEIPWHQHRLTFFGRSVAAPRLSAWYGDSGAVYSYSGLSLEPLPWTASLLTVRETVEDLARCRFNSVLANLYRDGRDGMGWHSDAEPELGRNPIIASVSLGAVRRFRFRHRKRPLRIDLDLPPGSVLLMAGATQHYWRHAMPKTKRPVEPRINLTFRKII